MGHVFWFGVGVKQMGPMDGPGPWTSQHSCASVHTCVPQQKPALGGCPKQGGFPQTPPLQYCGATPHTLPQVPQLCGSFIRLTHWSLQHVVPKGHPVGPQLPVPPAVPPDPPEPVLQSHTSASVQVHEILLPPPDALAQPIPGSQHSAPLGPHPVLEQPPALPLPPMLPMPPMLPPTLPVPAMLPMPAMLPVPPMLPPALPLPPTLPAPPVLPPLAEPPLPPSRSTFSVEPPHAASMPSTVSPNATVSLRMHQAYASVPRRTTPAPTRRASRRTDKKRRV